MIVQSEEQTSLLVAQEPSLLVNRWKTPDGTILQSKHRHDYVEHTDAVSGEWYMVDGGTSYVRRSCNKQPMQCLCLHDTDSIEDIRNAFYWGTRGVNGDEPLKYVLLKDLTTAHLAAIIAHIKRFSPSNKVILDLFLRERDYRNLLKKKG